MNIKQTKENICNKVFVGVSGGVDSSVTAAILKERGFDVTGVFIKIWHPDLLGCDWRDEMRDAMRVCAHLEIPFKMVDLAEEYRNKVIKYMVDSYKNGLTPNPDVMCNTHIKFGVFYDWAIENGADFVATGHYAQIKKAEENNFLTKGVDTEKDQSYFLWNIRKECLEKMILPIGEYKKSEVRQLAEKYKLPTAKKPDSQGLCFIGDVDLKFFLKKHITSTKGDVLDLSGKVIGYHDGALLYTTGERHGFKVETKNDSQEPLYVLSRNIEKNTITVGEKKFLEENVTTKIVLKNINLLSDIKSKEIDVVFKYHGKKEKAFIISKNEKEIILELDRPIVIPASGQSAVLYTEDFCIGGGVIQ